MGFPVLIIEIPSKLISHRFGYLKRILPSEQWGLQEI